MVNRKYFAVFMTLIVNCSLGYCQQSEISTLDTIAGSFIGSLRKNPSEKIFIATDKSFYNAGETIWLNAYSLNALSHRPIHLSKNLFLDLVNDKDSVISQLLLNIRENKTGGNILLPPSLKEGYYWLRAYTREILRQDSNRIFVKPVYILNAGKPDPHFLHESAGKTNFEAEDTSEPRILFLPEGGSIIAGTTATVAFRAMSANGKPLEVSGFITDTRDSLTTTFKTSLPGLGKFTFDAWNPRKYFAHIRWKNKRELIYPLPHINQFACQLSLIEQTSQSFRIRVSLGDSLYKKNKRTYLLGISRDSLCFVANGADMYDVTIPKSIFPKGKATLFLFNDQKQIVSQRAIYIDTGSSRISVEPDKVNYGPRERVMLDLGASAPDGRPLTALFSLSVTDDRLSAPMADQNIISGMNSDDIELPESGLSPDAGWEKKYSAQEIDLIMLAQKNLNSGWEFNKAIEQTTATSPDPDSNLLNIRGRIVNKKNEPVIGCMVDLLSKQKGIFLNDTTDGNGHFQFSIPDYDNGEQFNLKVTDLKGKGLEGRVVLDKFPFPQFTTPRQLKKRFGMSEQTMIRHFKSIQSDSSAYGNGLLNPVTVKGEKPNEPGYDVTKRVSSFSYIITSDKLSNGDPNALVNAIQAVPGLNTGMTSVSMNGGGDLAMSANYLVVLDGIPHSGSDGNEIILSINPLQVDFVEVLKGGQSAIYGVQGSTAVILINTISKIREVTTVDDKGMASIYPRGYFKQTEFPSPDYDKKEKNKKSSLPDQRSTIYWNPELVTNNKGKAVAVFFTADDAGPYSISLSGVTATGELIYKQIKIRQR